MSYQSAGPEVYQYAPQTKASFASSPFYLKPLNSSIEVPPISTYQPKVPPTYYGSQFKPTLTFTPNIYQPVITPGPSIRPSLGVEVVTKSLQQNAHPNPEAKVESNPQAVQPTQNNPAAEQTADRYDNYLEERVEQYKYDIFSIADEPWNRCVNGDGCAKLPGNQCITRPNPRKYWE